MKRRQPSENSFCKKKNEKNFHLFSLFYRQEKFKKKEPLSLSLLVIVDDRQSKWVDKWRGGGGGVAKAKKSKRQEANPHFEREKMDKKKRGEKTISSLYLPLPVPELHRGVRLLESAHYGRGQRVGTARAVALRARERAREEADRGVEPLAPPAAPEA